MRFQLLILLAGIPASCGGSDVVSERGPQRSPTSLLVVKLAELQASAGKPLDATEEELEELCKRIIWPGVNPWGRVVAVDGSSVAVRLEGDSSHIRSGARVLVYDPSGRRGILEVSEAMPGHVIGPLVLSARGYTAVEGHYAQLMQE
jgi:hypothetical protein